MPRFHDLPLYSGGGLSLTRVACDGDDGAGPSEESVDRDHAILALRGRFVFRDRDGRSVIAPARALMLRAGDTYTIEHPGGESDVCLSVEGRFLADLCAPGGRTRSVSAAWYAAVQGLIGALAAGLAVDRLAVEETVCGALASADSPASASRRDRTIAETIAYVVEVEFDRPLVLSDVAAAAGVSVFHACRVFRRVMRTSIHRYRQSVRLRHALALLLDSRMSVARIAAETGFANQGHLGNIFRRRFGLTPAQARLTMARAATPVRAGRHTR